MARSGPSFYTNTAKAGADLSAKQYHFMRFSAADTVNQSSEAADLAYAGVLLNAPESGEAATIRRGGMEKITAGASATVHDLITTNGSGRAIAVASGDTAMVMGRFLEAPGGDGEIVTAEIYESPYLWAGLAI